MLNGKDAVLSAPADFGNDHRRRILLKPIRTLEHHQYFGPLHVPSYTQINMTKDEAYNKRSTDKNKNAALMSLPRSSLATIKPENFRNEILSTDYNYEKARKKSKKNSGIIVLPPKISPSPSSGGVKQLSPTSVPLSVIENSISPSFTTEPISFPLIQNVTKDGSVVLTNSSDNMSKEQAAITTVIATASGVVMIALLLFTSIHYKKRIRTKALNSTTDPALCGDASLSSELSSTFCYDEAVQPKKDSQGSWNAPKSTQSNDVVTLTEPSHTQNQAGIIARLLNFVSVSEILNSKKNRTLECDENYEKLEFFPPRSPYLVDEITSTSFTARDPNTREEKIIENTVGPIIVPSQVHDSLLHEAANDHAFGCPISSSELKGTGEVKQRTWQAAVNIDNNSEPKLYHDNSIYNPTDENDMYERDFRRNQIPPISVCTSIGGLIKQRSLDEESAGTLDVVSSDIINQFKIVDQRLSEGFDQFRAVDQRLSVEFDKLEATLAKNGQLSRATLNTFEMPDKNSLKVGTEDLSIACGLDLNSISTLNHQQVTNIYCDDDSSCNDDSDDAQHHIPNHFVSPFNIRRRNMQQKSGAKFMEQYDLNNVDRLPLEEQPFEHTRNYSITSYSKSILNLPNDDKSDEDDDIFTASDDDKLTFEQIRSRFDQDKH